MNRGSFSRIEINVFNPIANLGPISDLAAKYGAVSIVAIPQHIAALVLQRGILRGKYKIICALDPENKLFAMDKISKLKHSPQGADGYEIPLSKNRTQAETRNEIKILTEFLRSNNQLMEIRWNIDALLDGPADRFEYALTVMKQFPPASIRVGAKLSVEDMDQLIARIRKFVGTPLKIDGNTDGIVDTYDLNRDVKWFDITDVTARDWAHRINNPEPAAKPKTDGSEQASKPVETATQ